MTKSKNAGAFNKRGAYGSVYTVKANMVLKLLTLSALVGIFFSMQVIIMDDAYCSSTSDGLLKDELFDSVYVNIGLLDSLDLLPMLLSCLPVIAYIKNDFQTSCVYVIPRADRTGWFLKQSQIMAVYALVTACGYILTNVTCFAIRFRKLLYWPHFIYMVAWILVLYFLMTYLTILLVNILSIRFRPFISLALTFIGFSIFPGTFIHKEQETGLLMIADVLWPLQNYQLQEHTLIFPALAKNSYQFFTPLFSLVYFIVFIGLVIAIGARVVKKMDFVGSR